MASTNPNDERDRSPFLKQFWRDVGALVQSGSSRGPGDSMYSADGMETLAPTSHLEAKGNGDNEVHPVDAGERSEDDDDGYYADESGSEDTDGEVDGGAGDLHDATSATVATDTSANPTTRDLGMDTCQTDSDRTVNHPELIQPNSSTNIEAMSSQGTGTRQGSESPDSKTT